MLSAVAARKIAAKAAAETSATPSSKRPSPTPQKLPITSKPASKRKHRASAPSKNKKVKVAHTAGSVRYFVPGDASNAWNGTTPDESRIEANSESDSSSSGEEIEIAVDIPQPVGLSSISITKTKRAWSPSQPMQDSSDEEESGASASIDPSSYLPSPTPRKPEALAMSTFRPVLDHNVYLVPGNEHGTTEKACILVLQPNETLALVGTYSFSVLQGGVSLLGVTLLPSDAKYTVFAPRSSPIPVLSWISPPCQGSCTIPLPPAIQQQANTTAILIKYADTGVEGLGKICKVFENVFRPPRESDAVPGIDPPRVHVVYRSTKDTHPFVLPTSWNAALASVDEHRRSEINSAPVCLVKGPKKSGKSTFARTLVNRLLSRYRRVVFLECDLGQSEFTPGGMVALNVVENYVFGPSYTHPSLPYRAHYIGSVSPRTSPSQYLHSIRALLETYKLELQFPVMLDDSLPDERIYDAIPLVVNTMGWTKGLGADLNARIEEFVEPSYSFEIDGPEEKGWPTPLHSQHIPQATSSFMQRIAKHDIKVEAIHPEMTNTHHTATDHRHLNILSYFCAVFPELPTSSSDSVLRQLSASSWDTSLPLCARYPYEVDYTQAFDHVYLTGAGYEDVVPSELTRVLNGAIVGLVSANPTHGSSRLVQSTKKESSSLPYTPAEPPPDSAQSTCHGLGLIRGIPLSLDAQSPHMHILTPVPTGLLAQTRVLVKGEMELPIWGMLDFGGDDEGRVAGVEKGQVPYLQWGKAEGIGGEKRRVRRNLMRKAQM